MKRLATYALVMAALTGLLASCTDTSCYDNRSSVPMARFYTVNSSGTASLTAVTLWAMGVGVPGDSLLCDGETRNDLYLPLQVTATSTAFALWRTVDDVTVRDTITLTYRPVAYFASRECGAMYNFDVSAVTCTTHGIDSVVLVNNPITNEIRESLRIYLATDIDTDDNDDDEEEDDDEE